jgi:hypothetical protein
MEARPGFITRVLLVTLILSVLAGVLLQIWTPILPWVNEEDRPSSELPIDLIGLFVSGLLLGFVRPGFIWTQTAGVVLGESLFFCLTVTDLYYAPWYIFLFVIYSPSICLGSFLGGLCRKGISLLGKSMSSSSKT